jgi:hypothetical protein
MTNLSAATPSEHHGTVRGKLVDEDGSPITGAHIELFAKSIRSETELGEAATDEQGLYTISYFRPNAFNLVVRAYSIGITPQVVLAQSSTVFNAPAEAEIDFTTAADGVIRVPSTFTKIANAVSAHLQEEPLSGLRENKDTHELQFLASSTEVPFNHIAFRFIAAALAARNGLKDATLFGLFTQSIPPALNAALVSLPDAGIDDAFIGQVFSGVLAHSRSVLSQALTSAVKADVLPASYASFLESELNLLDSLRVQSLGNAPYLRGKTSLSDLLNAGGISEAVQASFVKAFADHDRHLESTRATLRAKKELVSEDLDKLDVTLCAGKALGGNLLLVKDTFSRLSQKQLASVQDLALLDENDWVARITALDPEAASIAPVFPDDPASRRIARFAKALTERFAAEYPTTTFAARLAKAQTSSFADTKDELVTFLTAHPKFDLKTTNIDHFVATNKVTLSAAALRDAKIALRLWRLGQGYDAVEALRGAGHSSALSVYSQGRGPFVAQMTTALGSASAANMTYARAHMTYATALTAFGRYNLALNGTSVAALASAAPDPTLLTNLPDLQALFGSLDSFECADCQSVLSPAAYLVDLLQYLGQIGAGLSITGATNASPIAISTPGPHGLQTGAQVTIARVLGNTSANGGLFTVTVTSPTSFTLNGSTGNGNWAGGGYISFTGLQSARDALFARRPDIQYTALSCNNTNITIPYIDLVNEILEAAISPPSTPITLIDTTGTVEERRALPQQVSENAYTQTAGAVFPFVLPFDLGFARTAAYINALGTTRIAILSLFASNPPTAAQAAAIAGASLGINPEMQAIINGTDTHDPWDYWGLAVDQATVIDPKTRTTITLTPPGWVTALSRVPVLLNRAAITLQELYQLLEVVWVTESGVALEVGTTQNASMQILNPDTDLMVFTGLTADVLTRANSFLRLWVASGLQMWELDWAIKGFGNSLAGDFLPYLTGAIAVQQQLKLPLQEVLTFWLPLETHDVVSHLGDEDTVVLSTYSEVFLNPALLVNWSSVFVPLSTITITAASSGPGIVTSLPHGYLTGMQVLISGTLAGAAVSGTYTITVTGVESFVLDGFANTGAWAVGGTVTGVLSGIPIFGGASAPPTVEQLAISAALGLSAADISAVITFSGAANTLSLGTLGQLLNYQRLASALSLDIPHLILWITLTAGKPFGWEPKDTQEFLRRLAVLQGTGLAAEDFNYLLLNQSPDQSALALTASQAAAILQTVRDAVARLPGATAISITGASNASPITITTAAASALVSGTQVGISGVEGNSSANGTFIITVVSPTSFTLNGSTGNGAWTSGGTVAFQAIPADPSMIQAIVINALTAATGTTATVITPVLGNTGALPLAATTIDLLIAQANAVDPTLFTTLISAFSAVAKAAVLFNALKLTAAEFVFAMTNAVSFNWLDPSLPAVSPVADPYTPVEALLWAIRLNRRQSTVGSALFDVLGWWLAPSGLPTNLTAAISALVPALNTNLADLQSIVSALGAAPPKLPAPSGSLTDMAMLTSIANALDTAVRYRISGADLVTLATLAPTPNTASTAMTTLQAQYPQGSWFAAIQPVEDVLRQNRRDALVAYMLGTGPAVPIPAMLTTDDIYDYYLIDPEMSPCGQTTRLLQPSLAIQQFVQQCSLNLTFLGVTVDMTSPLWDEWSWRQQYRLWQANREVFLYPENYVLPETRTDASSFFQDLENDLRQTNADADGAEAALENYLRKLLNVSRLQVAAHYNETKIDGSTVAHVFAHTRDLPWQWFTRRRTGLTPTTGSWSAWEPLNLDIGSQQVIPFVWDQRLHVLIPVFKQISEKASPQAIPQPDSSNKYPAQQTAQKFWSVEFGMSEFSAGQWQAKRNFENKLYLNSEADPLAFTFRASGGATGLYVQVYSSVFYAAGSPATNVLIAQAILPDADSPLLFVESASALPDSTLIDTVQEPTFRLISTPPTSTISSLIGELFTPADYVFSGQDVVYSYGQSPLDTPVALNVLCLIGASAGSLTTANIALLGSITNPRISYSEADAIFESQDPFFVQDPSRSYLVQPHYYASSSTYQELPNHDGLAQWYTRFAFQTYYHPFARLFLRQLEVGGVPKLMDRQLQTDPQSVRGWDASLNFNFTAHYLPGAQVKEHYPGDPPLFFNPDPGESALDFATGSSGAYSLYNWELFYHVPMFVASLLMQNQQYQDAMTWLEYIFNPMDNSGGTAPQRFWQTAPFYWMLDSDWTNEDIESLLETLAADEQQNIFDSATANAITAWMADPFDPHLIASLRISAYAKATVMKFLDNLIGWGDSYYSQYTAETVNQAEQLYVLADLILGPRPDSLRPPNINQGGTTNETYATLQNLSGFASGPGITSTNFSNVLVNIENLIVAPEPPQAIVNGTVTTPSLATLPGNASTLLFCVPQNAQLLAYWDTVSQRLSNIRSCRTLQGVVQPLPLYAPPLNPLFLVEDLASGSNVYDSPLIGPVYRFATYLQKAIELTNDVRAYGSLILSALEKQDTENLSVLRANQELNIQIRLLDIKRLQVAEAADQITALQYQKAVVQKRYDFYSTRAFMNPSETAAMTLQLKGLLANELAVVLDTAAGVAHLIPTEQVGAAGWGGVPYVTAQFGGADIGSSSSAWASVARGLGGLATQQSAMAGTIGSYQRRADDWSFQAALASAELTQLDSQIAAANQRLTIATTELGIQNTQISNAQAVSTFLTSKYTNQQLYSWMVTQLTAIYTQAYQLAFSLALQAQNAYRYELGTYSDTFIQSGYWDSQHKGLTAGESLVFDLRRMEAQYLAGNSRELELTRHVSLVLTSPAALVMLRETGECAITLDETLFDSDHPGHYFRRLRAVALTIPCVTGPYTGVNATLSQGSAVVRVQPPDSTYQPWNFVTPPSGQPVVSSPIAPAGATTIATSHGQNDAGLFDASPRDERWLPFEGRGAVSTWNLTLDPRDNNFDFSTITDVILHIRYTARGGGDANTVRAQILSQIETSRSVLVSARNTFGNAYYTFFNPAVAAATAQTLTLPLSNVLFPYSNLGSGAKIAGINVHVLLSVPAAGNTIAGTFGVTGVASPAALTLAPSSLMMGDGTPAAALTGTAPLTTPLSAPQSFDLTVPSASVPAALATTVGGVTRLDPGKIEDILLIINYSID